MRVFRVSSSSLCGTAVCSGQFSVRFSSILVISLRVPRLSSQTLRGLLLSLSVSAVPFQESQSSIWLASSHREFHFRRDSGLAPLIQILLRTPDKCFSHFRFDFHHQKGGGAKDGHAICSRCPLHTAEYTCRAGADVAAGGGAGHHQESARARSSSVLVRLCVEGL